MFKIISCKANNSFRIVILFCYQDEGGAGGGLQLGFVAGVILRERLPAFEKMLWRACRGNVFLRVADIEDPLEDPHTGDEVIKSVFVIFFQGTGFCTCT